MADDKRHPDDSISEEVSAFGERVKGRGERWRRRDHR
jgi:hypothetical protein